MLKNITLLIALLLVNVKLITAQTLSIGPMIGANASTIIGVPDSKYLVGLSAGGFANYSINEHFGLGLKVLYSQLGTAYTNTTDIKKFNYLQIPLTAVIYFGDAGNTIRPKIFAGPYAGMLLSANNKNGDEFIGTDGTAVYADSDFGGIVGVGLNYRIQSRTWLNIDAGYGRSFSDISKTTDNVNKNSAFSLNVGISFPVSGK